MAGCIIVIIYNCLKFRFFIVHICCTGHSGDLWSYMHQTSTRSSSASWSSGSSKFIYRVLNAFMGRGKTLVSAGVILPSRVTNLIIKRPAGFNFSPGDWVFIKIPEVARFEWHPFTIRQEHNVTFNASDWSFVTNPLLSLVESDFVFISICA